MREVGANPRVRPVFPFTHLTKISNPSEALYLSNQLGTQFFAPMCQAQTRVGIRFFECQVVASYALSGCIEFLIHYLHRYKKNTPQLKHSIGFDS